VLLAKANEVLRSALQWANFEICVHLRASIGPPFSLFFVRIALHDCPSNWFPDLAQHKALTLALAEEALRVAQRVHPEVVYELSFLQAEPPPRVPGNCRASLDRQAGRLPETVPAGGRAAHRWPRRSAAPQATGARRLRDRRLSAGVYPLAQLGLLDGYRAAVHWRWQDDFAERFPKVIATSHLFDWDRDRLTACGGMSVLDLLLAVLARDHGAELAGAVSEELVVERIREAASASAFRCRTAWAPAIRS
jgi:transcriptional regulator GlxA family with amidase domain